MIRKDSDPGPIPSRYVTVEVTTQYEDEEDLRRTKACRVGNEARNERGILIWADHGHPHRVVNITVLVPLHLRVHKDITTDQQRFSHDIVGDFADWWSPTRFGVLRFKSSDAPILYHTGLWADSAFIQTSNARVEGDFTGTNRLHIHTSNAPIAASAWMSGVGAGSEITLSTSHGTVEGLFGVINSLAKTKLKIGVHTSHAAVRIEADPLGTMDTNSSLSLNVSTSEAPVSVYLYPAYEGKYDLETSGARAEVDTDLDILDPSGMGRQRTLQKTASGPHVHGYMYWSYNGDPSDEGKNRGTVNVRSSKSAITMYC
ncbi:hypothetical protein FB451DRAFT_1389975 [Mycena latifolia]|nr:hypothetical protein FB451DRAFT_1389975 [Mycena latifolia]